MKQLIALLIFSVISTFARSQVAVLATVSDIASYSNAATTTLFIKDVLRGGQFLLYSGSDAADNGMIFTDALSQKWKRVTTGDRISAQWYGAEAYAVSSHDSRADILAARDYIYAHTDFKTLYIPADSRGFYYCSDELAFNKSIRILGDGTINYPTTYIQFAPHKTGFVFSYTSGQNGFGVDLENLMLEGQTNNDPRDVTKHCITTKAFTRIDNVTILQYDGNGIDMSACALAPSGDNNNYGNVDLSVIRNVNITYCTNGIFLEGCDANSILFDNINVASNRRWGVYDNGFLGNMYLKPHAAFNGVPIIAGANAVVLYSDKYYAARPGHDGYFGDIGSNINKQPDTNPDYWYEVSTMTYNVWDNSTRYYSGGPICIRNANAWSNIVNAYTEAFQPSIYLNTRSKVDGGDNGAGVVNGSYSQMLYGVQYIKNSDVALPNTVTNQLHLTIGKDDIDYGAPLSIYNDQSKSGGVVVAKFETTSPSTYMQFKNPYSSGYIGYYVNDITFYTEGLGGLRALLNSSGFMPADNNTLDIGASSTKWKTGYFGTSLFSPSINGSSSSAGNLTLNSTSHATKGNIFFGSASVYEEPSGYFGLNTTSPTTYLDIKGDKFRIRDIKTPSSSTDTGNAGDICWDSNYLYVCVAANTWKRVAISTW